MIGDRKGKVVLSVVRHEPHLAIMIGYRGFDLGLTVVPSLEASFFFLVTVAGAGVGP